LATRKLAFYPIKV